MQAHNRLIDHYGFAPVGYVALSEKGLILGANLTFAEIVGIERDTMIRQPLSAYITDEGQDTYYQHINALRNSTTNPEPVELLLRRERGDPVWVEMDSVKLGAHDECDTQIRSVFQVITRRRIAEDAQKRVEAQMRQAQKLESLGVLTGGIAHDFNNILQVILGGVSLITSTFKHDESERCMLQQVEIAAKRASELTDQILTYSGNKPPVVEDVDLSSVVQEMLQLLDASHTKKSVVKYTIREGLPAVRGDQSQLRQIVMNLIRNASEALGEEGGLIAIETGLTEATQEYLATTYTHDDLPSGQYVFLGVSDDGCGMDRETQERLFEPFFYTKFAGRGLGMAAVLGILQSHKGAVDLQSEVGRGTTFKVLLPATDGPAKSSTENAPREKDWRGQGTVLVIDGESKIRTLSAEDGCQAIDIFREHKDDIVCVLLDLAMPKMDGEETFIGLREIRKDVPVILLSGYCDEELQKRIRKSGFAGFLKKPVDSDALQSKVHDVIEIAKAP